MPDFSADVLAPNQSNLNALMLPSKMAADQAALDSAQQTLADRATLRAQAGGFASNDPDVVRQAQATALSVPGVGGTESAAGVGTMHTDQRAQMDHAIQVASNAAQAILLMPADQRAAAYTQYLPTMRQLGLNLPAQYPGDESMARARDLGVNTEARIKLISSMPVLSTGGAPVDPFNARGPGGSASVAPAGGGTALAGSVDQLDQMLWGQESGGQANSRTSVDGARGGHQIMPGTFAQYAKPGESIDNPTDNANVGKRIVADLANRFGGDPARVAVAYFSGPDNVAPAGSATPWIADKKDGNGTSTSVYVSQALGRLRGAAPPATASAAPATPGAPTVSSAAAPRLPSSGAPGMQVAGPGAPSPDGPAAPAAPPSATVSDAAASAPPTTPAGSPQWTDAAAFAARNALASPDLAGALDPRIAAAPGMPLNALATPPGAAPGPAAGPPMGAPRNQLIPAASAAPPAPTKAGQMLQRNPVTGVPLEFPGKPGFGIGPHSEPVRIEGLPRDIVNTAHRDGSITQTDKNDESWVRTIQSPDVHTLQTGDPASPEYAGAYARQAAGKVGSDGQVAMPDMRAYRAPAAAAAAAPPGTPTVTGQREEPALQQMDQQDIQAIRLSASNKADLGALADQLKSGKVSLGGLTNLASRGLNATGFSTENSQFYFDLDATIEKLRNDRLTLEKGQQTEGDAQRAMTALITNKNDPVNVERRLRDLSRMYDRGIAQNAQELNRRRVQNGQAPIDISTLASQPAAVGPVGAQGVPARPAAVPEGSAYSPSRHQWRAPDGQLYPGGP